VAEPYDEGELSEMSFADKTLTCRDCGSDFVFTAGEQEFYAEKGFTNQPSRCSSCRSAAKAARGGGGGYSGGGGGYGGGGSYGGGGGGGGGMRAERTMHPAVCSSCGRDTEVPFVPTSGKPVYCTDCFRAQREDRSYNDRW